MVSDRLDFWSLFGEQLARTVPTMCELAWLLGAAAATRTAAVGAHELAHYLAAWLVGRRAFT